MKNLLWAGLLALSTAAGAAVTDLNRIVAVVNDDVVTAHELQERTEMVMKQIAKSNTPAPARRVLERQILDRLILERIQLKLAADAGLRVDDTEITQVIADIAARNQLSLDQFRGVLARDGVDFADFREQIRREMLISRLHARSVSNRVVITPQEVENYLATTAARSQLANEYLLSHILIALPEAASPADIAKARAEAEEVLGKLREGADFRQLAIAHSDGQQALEGGDLGWRRGSQLPTLFAEAVTTLKAGQTSELLRSPSGFHIIRLNDMRGADRSVVQQTRARHILIAPSAVLGDAEAKARAARLRERVLAGEDFATLARSHSDDKGSATEGGELGWASPGKFVPEFEQAMAGLAVGGVSQPFRSTFGWHIVQVLERRDFDNTDEVRRTRAAEALRERKIEEEMETWLRQIRDEAYVEYREE